MTIDTVDPAPHTPPGLMRRISWGAVLAGIIAALAIQLVLSVVGLAVGATAFEPLERTAPAEGLATGSGVWLALSTLVSLFFGGWIAGRMAGIPRRGDSALHGFLAWGLATLAAVYLFSTTVGSLVGGAAGMLGRTLATAVTGAAGLASEQLPQQDLDLAALRDEAFELLSARGGGVGASGERGAIVDPRARQLLDGLFRDGDNVFDAEDRRAAVSLLTERTDLTRAEAERTVDQWAQRYEEAVAKAEETRAVAALRSRELGAQVADTVARTAAWAAALMALGAAAATLGGMAGAPREAYARKRRRHD